MEKEKRKSVGVEEYARRKYQEYEKQLEEEKKRKQTVEDAQKDLARRDQ